MSDVVICTPRDWFATVPASHQQEYSGFGYLCRHELFSITTPFFKQASLGYVPTHRKFFTTTEVLIGLGPRSMCTRDICIVSGSEIPHALREEKNHYRFLGKLYVHEPVEGEAVGETTMLANLDPLMQAKDISQSILTGCIFAWM